MASKVLDSFNSLKKILESEGDLLVIRDDPIVVVICNHKIDFYVNDEYQGSVGRDYCSLSELVLFEARLWLEALANLKFRRYQLRK